jgi:hypothetical protein
MATFPITVRNADDKIFEYAKSHQTKGFMDHQFVFNTINVGLSVFGKLSKDLFQFHPVSHLEHFQRLDRWTECPILV